MNKYNKIERKSYYKYKKKINTLKYLKYNIHEL